MRLIRRSGPGKTVLLVTQALLTGALSAQAPDGAHRDCAATEASPGAIRCSLTALRMTPEMRPPELDGRLDEAAWALAVPAVGFVQFAPDPGEPATERTEARIIYDDAMLYVGMRMFDSDPDSIRAQFVRRDDIEASSDWAHVYIDSYHDRRTAFHFATTPTGTRADILHLEDTGTDESWNAVWDVATRIEEWGWSAEFRIPLSQLRFGGGDDLVWGVNFRRDIARRSESSYWIDVPPQSGRLVSLFGDLVGLQDLHAPGRLEMLPYTVARLRRETVDPNDPFRDSSDWWGSVGADVKYGLTSDLTLTATINPDFGQVDADPSVVNLGTTETFLQERRPFFTEGAEIFRFPLQPEGHAFYSRRIGRPPQIGVSTPADGFTDVPQTTSILGALKLSGKTRSGWSVGFLHAMTARENARIQNADRTLAAAPVEPATQYTAGRVQRDFRRGSSGIGAIATAVHRKMSDPAFDRLHSAAYVGAIDGWHRFGDDRFEVSGWILGSNVRGSEDAIARTQRSLVHLFQQPDAGLTYDPTRTTMSGYAGELYLQKIGGGHWTWRVAAGTRSPGVETNDLGFVSYTNVWYSSARARYSEFTPGPLLRSWHVEAEGTLARTYGGELVRPSVIVRTRAQLLNFWTATLNTTRWQSYLWPWELRGGPILRVQGYTDLRGTLSSDTRKSWQLQLRGTFRREDGEGGHRVVIDPVLDLRPTSRTTVSMSPSITWNRTPDQYVASAGRSDGAGTEYIMGRLEQTTASLTLRFSYSFTPEMTFDFYGQPFISSGRYSEYLRVTEPRAKAFTDRYTPIDPVLSAATDRYGVDEDGDGSSEYTFRNRDFNVRELRTNAVLRWEYQPGSVLYVVWSQARDDDFITGPIDLGGDVDRLFGAPASNVFMIKISYWLGY